MRALVRRGSGPSAPGSPASWCPPPTSTQVLLRDERAGRVEAVVASLGDRAVLDDRPYEAPADADVVVLAGPAGTHRRQAEVFLPAGSARRVGGRRVRDVRGLLDLDAEARERGLPVVVGAGFAPGLTCVLARHAAARFDEVDEIHVARAGTGGPACARQHHRALGGTASTGATAAGCGARAARAGSCAGSPIRSARRTATGPRCPTPCCSCRPSPAVERVTARLAANRRDRLTARLPMLRPPHPEGGPGGRAGRGAGPAGQRRETSPSSAPWTARRWPPGRWPRWPPGPRSPGELRARRRRRPGRAGRAGARSWPSWPAGASRPRSSKGARRPPRS